MQTPFDITMGLDTPLTIRQLRSLTHNTNAEVVNAHATGESSLAAVFQGQTPHSANFTSTDLKTLLTANTSAFISSGVCVGDAVTPRNTDVPFRARECAGYAQGASHIAIRSTRTVLTPDSLSAPLNESASLDCTMRYISANGFSSPVAPLSGQTLAAANFVGEYMLHSVLIDGVAVPQLQGATISPGISVQEQKAPGSYITAVYMPETIPTIEVTTEDLESAQAVIDAADLGSGVTVYLAKRKNGAIIELPASTNHIAITAAAGLRQAITLGGDTRQNGSASLRINPLALTAAVDVAIP